MGVGRGPCGCFQHCHHCYCSFCCRRIGDAAAAGVLQHPELQLFWRARSSAIVENLEPWTCHLYSVSSQHNNLHTAFWPALGCAACSTCTPGTSRQWHHSSFAGRRQPQPLQPSWARQGTASNGIAQQSPPTKHHASPPAAVTAPFQQLARAVELL